MLASLCLIFVQGLEPYPPSRYDRVIPITIDADDPLIEGRGRADRIDYVSEFSGTLHLWTSVAEGVEVDAWLRVENVDGTLVADDDDSGGGMTPYLELQVAAGCALSMIVGSRSDVPRHELWIHAIAANETLDTVAAARAAGESIAEIKQLRESKKVGAARELATETFNRLLEADGIDESDLVHEQLLWLGLESHRLDQLQRAGDALRRAAQHRARTLPAEHHELQVARHNLASTLHALGNLKGARTLQEAVLEVMTSTLPAEHSELQSARANLAATLAMLGDLEGARTLQGTVLEIYSRILPADHPDLQAARGNLAATLNTLGDFEGARTLQKAALEVLTRTLPAEHVHLLNARGNLANTLFALGDQEGARTLLEDVLEVRTRTLPADHPALQTTRANLAATLKRLGDLTVARNLEEAVLEVRSRILPDYHPDLQSARGNLANTLLMLGDLEDARTLQEAVLEVRSRALPAEHPHLQAARESLAATLFTLGDFGGAQTLITAVLEVLTRILPDDHPFLQSARGNLALTRLTLGDFEGARHLQEAVLEIRSRTLPAEHPELQLARENLAGTLLHLGDVERALSLQEAVIESYARILPAEHPDLRRAQWNLALMIALDRVRVGDGQGEPPEVGERAQEYCLRLLLEATLSQSRAARELLLASPAREAEARCFKLANGLGLALSFSQGYGVFDSMNGLEKPAFILSETTRDAAITAGLVTRFAASHPQFNESRHQLQRASNELANAARAGTTAEAFHTARRTREVAERALIELSRELGGGTLECVDLEVERLVFSLGDGVAGIGFRRFVRSNVHVNDKLDSTRRATLRESSVVHLCAFVVRGSSKVGSSLSSESTNRLQLIDLGPIEPIEAAVAAWRAAIGLGSESDRGEAEVPSDPTRSPSPGLGLASERPDITRQRGQDLRKLIFDPVVEGLHGARRVVVALDDVLHLVPLDALPLGESGGPVGDRWQIETRATLTELLYTQPLPDGTTLVALGGASFSAKPTPFSEVAAPTSAESLDPSSVIDVASILRGGNWSQGFSDLPGSKAEAIGVAALHAESFESVTRTVTLYGANASRASLLELAPKARFLHIATHGWFAPESIKSWHDPRPLDMHSGLGLRLSGEETIRGMSPMLLCGLALAGANLPEDAVGRPPGLITADELSTLDLSGCELAVLSACDTNVGIRRAGQGVASLQRALQMAGARTVITSLWTVPDEATKELMLDFYRLIWVEKTPKAEALWAAKKRMRDAKDEGGQPKYTLRDWAGWVLTGDPN